MKRIQQIFREHSTAFLQAYPATSQGQRNALRAIQDCGTGACGHHRFACPDCGRLEIAASSCGNRHCPVCQHRKAAQWVYRQELKLLPCAYFLATFTLPEALRAVAFAHPRAVYDALMDEAAAALRTLEADPRFVGCHVAGFFGLLHTWTRQLEYHPHAHFVIPGGGLSADRRQWVTTRGDFLVHVRALSRLFRGRMKGRLEALGLLAEVPGEVWTGEWVVHCKAVGSGRESLRYMGAYVSRVAISDNRIVAYDGHQVTFRYQKVGSAKWRRVTVSALEFIRRFLLHVLPTGFVKIRHFGFLSPNFGISLDRIRDLICILYDSIRRLLPPLEPPRVHRLRCPQCRQVMRWVAFIPPRLAPTLMGG
jgi:hypothetical protein